MADPTFPYAIQNPYTKQNTATPYANISNRVAFQFWRSPVIQASDGTYQCPGFDGPTYASNPWDFVYIGTTLSNPNTPGLCKVEIKRERERHNKKAAGADGTRVTFNGLVAAEVVIEFLIWTPEQLRQLAALWPLLFPEAYKGAPPAYDVAHPLFTIHKIKALQFHGGAGPVIDAQARGVFTMKAVEYLPPKTINTTKTATQALDSTLGSGAVAYPTPDQNTANLAPR